MRNLLQGLFVNMIWELIKFSLSVATVGALSLITSNAFTKYTNYISDDNKLYFTILVVSISLLLFILVYRRYFHYRPVYPHLELDFLIKEKALTMAIVDLGKNKYSYTKKVVLLSLKKGIDSYTDRYSWTGSDKPLVHSNISNQVFKETVKRNIFQYYSIIFPRKLKKGEDIETELVWSLTDTEKKMVPFISATIEEPTELLTLKVEMPSISNIKEVICEVSSNIGSNKVFETFSKKVDRNGVAVWSIKKPKLLFHYEMRWYYWLS